MFRILEPGAVTEHLTDNICMFVCLQHKASLLVIARAAGQRVLRLHYEIRSQSLHFYVPIRQSVVM